MVRERSDLKDGNDSCPPVVLIAADIEGTSAYVKWPLQPPEEAWHRKQMTAEVNAAIEGALAAGVKEVIVSDIHWTKQNILPDLLNPCATLIRGSGRKLLSMDGVKNAQLVFLIGFHACAGRTNAILPHTLDTRIVRMKINGREAGEIFLTAAIAGYFGVPLGMVAGDRAAVDEAGEFFPAVEKVTVKEGIGSSAAVCLHPAKSLTEIRCAAERAVERAMNGEFSPYRLPDLVTLEIEFIWPDYAGVLSLIPGVLRSGGREITYVGRWPDIIRIVSLFVNWVKEIPGIF